jgi:membrane-bound lytic murein transglycosylase F
MKKKRSSRDFFILILFYVNLAIYVGGDFYWKLRQDDPVLSDDISAPSNEEYSHIIEKYAQRNGLDWRFVSSIIHTESSFKPDAISSAGAIGLMQIMPRVASAEGVSNISDPEVNIKFGVMHYKRYFNRLKGDTLDDTLKINLAAYNAGYSHIRDAQRLATLLNLNPRKWESLEKTLPLLEDEAFHPFVKDGFCQGNSVVAYVKKVFRTYQQYRTTHPDFPSESKVL